MAHGVGHQLDEIDDRTSEEQMYDRSLLMRKLRPGKRLGGEQYLQPEQLFDHAVEFDEPEDD